MQTPDLDDPDLPLAQIFAHWPQTASVFLTHRMLCFGCPIAPFHSVTDACAEYSLEEAPFRRELLLAAGLTPQHRSAAADGAGPAR